MTDEAANPPVTETDALSAIPSEPVQGPIDLVMDQVMQMLAIGGPVVAILLAMSPGRNHHHLCKTDAVFLGPVESGNLWPATL